MATTAPQANHFLNRPYPIAAVITTLFSFVYILWLAIVAQQFSTISEISKNQMRLADTYTGLVEELTLTIGYGGLIHNFKNYVLRQDDAYYEAIQNDFEHFEATLRTLENLLTMPEDLRRSEAVRDAMTQYWDRTAIIKDLISAGKSAQEIDTAVMVDDKIAINAVYDFVRFNAGLRDQATAAITQKAAAAITSIYLSMLILLAFIAMASYLITLMRRRTG